MFNKKLIKLFGITAAAAGLTIVSCKPESGKQEQPQPSVSLKHEVSLTTKTTLGFSAEVQNSEKAAFIVEEQGKSATAPTAERILSEGTALDINSTEPVKIENLIPGTTYNIYAASSAGELYSQIAKIEAVTGDYTPTVSMNLQSVNSSSVTFILTSTNADKLAYSIIENSETVPAAEEILENGNQADASAPNTYTIDGLMPATQYKVVAVAANEWITSEVSTLDIATEEVKEAKAGDFYYSDGTWSSGSEAPLTGKECIGIVFLAGRGTSSSGGQDSGKYKIKDGSADMENINGYVVSLKQPEEGSMNAQWGSTGTEVMTTTEKTDFEGYFNTQKIIEKAGGNLSADGSSNFPAAYYAVDVYEKAVPAPAMSSGWFLPSAGQLKFIYDSYEKIHASMDKLPEDTYLYVYRRDAIYWSSTEYLDSYDQGWKAWMVNMDESNITPGYVSNQTKSKSYMVRPVLVF